MNLRAIVFVCLVLACGPQESGADGGAGGGNATAGGGNATAGGGNATAGGGVATAGGSGSCTSANNPDAYAGATVTFRSADYESATVDPAFETSDISDLAHEPAGGFNGTGAWKLTPRPIPTGPDTDEGLAGWKWWPEQGMAADSTQVLVVSYLLQLSPRFVADVARQNYPQPNYGICKIIDLQMWNAAGTSPEFGTRQIVQMLGWRDADQGRPAGGIYLAHVNGGAGGRYINDGVNTPLDLAQRPGEWVWISHVFDARAGQQKTTTYYKRPGDSAVTRSLVRTAAIEYAFAGTYQYTNRGWASPTNGYNSALWGYWGDIIYPGATDRYVKLDAMRSGNGWLCPPF
ncbi:MAG: hypothetical protein JNK82_05615 [Myxococcaceae bacterium]|nr:hypothetical protein [Myxococcaceae bacterium]